VPPPYGRPQGYPTYPAPPVYPAYQKPVPRRRRPSGWWFVVGSLLMLAGLGIGILLIVQTVLTFTETDATIQADGQAHTLSVYPDRDRMVWIRPDEPQRCAIVDSGTGGPVDLEDVDADYTKDVGSGEWEAVSRFDPGSGDLEITCAATGGEIQIGPAPEFGELVGGLAAGIIIPLLLGGTGFVMLIVVGVLFATGRPRTVPAPQ
jgi:hypothetical protein